MKKVLLIGRTGQLAQALIRNASVYGFSLFPFTRKDLDVTNVFQLEKKINQVKPNVVINTSAYHVVPKCEEYPEEAFLVNAVSVCRAAQICKKYKVTFVTYSSDYVFDGKKGYPYDENDRPNPLQIYGLTKLAGEYASLNYYPERTFVIRTCGLYGGKTGSPEKGGNFVLNILKEAKNKTRITVSSEQTVSPTYAGDLSQATFRLLKKKSPPGLYHLVNEGYCSWYEFAKEIFKSANIKKKVIPIDRRGKSGDMQRPLFSALINTKAKKLGIILPSWQEGLRSYFYELEASTR